VRWGTWGQNLRKRSVCPDLFQTAVFLSVCVPKFCSMNYSSKDSKSTRLLGAAWLPHQPDNANQST